MGTKEEWLSPKQLAETFGISIRTVYNWNYRRKAEGHEAEGPRSYKIGGNLRYRASDVERWLEERASGAAA